MSTTNRLAAISRRVLLAAGASSIGGPALLAQSGPIRIIFPFAAGGVGDALARLVADAISRALGETVIVEARPGAGGQVGVQAVKMAPPDGRTLLSTPVAPITIHPILYPNLPYDPFRDLAPISQISTFDFALAVGPATPVASVAELVALLKQDPKRATFGSPGAGTLPHFFGISMGRAIGVDMQHAAYRGSAPALTDLVAGQVPMVMTTTSDVVELARAGRIRVLAVSGKTRSPFLPDVPTFTEVGLPISGDAWYGLYATAGSPPAMVERLNKAVVEALRGPDLKERILKLSMVPTGTTPAEFDAIQKADHAFWKPAVIASGFRPD